LLYIVSEEGAPVGNLRNTLFVPEDPDLEKREKRWKWIKKFLMLVVVAGVVIVLYFILVAPLR